MAMLRQGDLEITVNGQAHTVQADPETPLLYVLRNELNLNAAKFGCGLVAMRRVHRPRRRRTGPLLRLAGRAKWRARGHDAGGAGHADDPHPIQQAFLEEQAAQCGYCIPGMMMTAAALLAQNTPAD